MVIIIEDVHRVGEEVNKKAVDVEELVIVMQTEAMCNHARRWFIKII